jgi:TonB family protein
MFMYDDEKPSFIPYLAVSIAVHVLLLSLLSSGINIPKLNEEIVEIFPVVEKNGAYEIADIAKPAVEKKPEKARFLGMYDSSVERETVAVTTPGKRGAKKSGAGEEAKKQRSPDAEMFNKAERGPLFNFDRKLFASRRPDIEAGGGRSSGSEFREDFYPDYKLGDRTYLNVLRYPDVDYFVRMKRQFKMTFNPAPALRQYFSMNRVTQGSVEAAIAVTVDRSGNLAELFVLKSSGISSYDQEAMRTVRASSPFARPPEKFVEDDGVLRMSWTFTVYL